MSECDSRTASSEEESNSRRFTIDIQNMIQKAYNRRDAFKPKAVSSCIVKR